MKNNIKYEYDLVNSVGVLAGRELPRRGLDSEHLSW